MKKKQHTPIIVGHGGALGLAPENGLEGMRLAIKYGVDQIEVDLRLTADGVVVLRHDDTILDERGKIQSISLMSYKELKAREPDLLTLDAAITFVKRRARLMLEIKDHSATAATIDMVDKFLRKGWKPADFMIASFQYQPLATCKNDLPGVDLVVLDDWSGVRATYRARKLGTPYLSMNQAYLWPGFIRSIARHYKLFCYPPRYTLPILRNRQPNNWGKYGLYGIITDYPDRYASAIVKTNESNTPSR